MTLTLTNSQRMALSDILAAYIQLRDHPQEFVDASTEPATLTLPEELLRLVLEAREAVASCQLPVASYGQALTRDQTHEIFRKIAAGERKHGDFLTTFAQAFIRADGGNEGILFGPARLLIAKYQLESYATAPPDTDAGDLIRGATGSES